MSKVSDMDLQELDALRASPEMENTRDNAIQYRELLLKGEKMIEDSKSALSIIAHNYRVQQLSRDEASILAFGNQDGGGNNKD